MDISLAFAAGVLFSACLHVPHAPNDVQKISKVSVFAKQFDEAIEAPIKINSTEQAELIAEVTPSKYKNKIKYYWYNDDEILDSGATYTIRTNYMTSNFLANNFIPDRLVIKDDEGNSLETTFTILEIDGIQYQVGELQQVMHSGFGEGSHTFRVLVMDSLGDKDSIAVQEFFVIDTLEAK